MERVVGSLHEVTPGDETRGDPSLTLTWRDANTATALTIEVI